MGNIFLARDNERILEKKKEKKKVTLIAFVGAYMKNKVT